MKKPTVGEVYEALRLVEDPELYMSILDLGLVYRVAVSPEGTVEVDFTVTYPGCPAAEVIQYDIVNEVKTRTGAPEVEARLVMKPAWRPDRMTEEARLVLGYPI